MLSLISKLTKASDPFLPAAAPRQSLDSEEDIGRAGPQSSRFIASAGR